MVTKAGGYKWLVGQVFEMLFSSILILIVAKALPLIKISSIHFTRITTIILILSGILSFNILYIQSIGSGIGIYSGLFQITNISQTIELFLLIIGSMILIGWPTKESKYSIDYSIIILFSTLGSSLLVSSFDLISLYLSIELQSFGLYILSTLYRNSESSTNAGLKYFLLGGLSSCIILLGIGIIYAYTGLTQLESIYTLISSIPAGGTNIDYILQGTLLGIILIFIGFLFKISAAPLHNWSPDVYDETPTIVTIWLTIMPKIAILILLLEIYTQINIYGLSIINIDTVAAPEGYIFTEGVVKNIFLISSILSLIIGTVVGLAQIKIKRLLAYSTISHIGFMLLALAINTEQSIDSFLFYLIQYIITNLNIFLILLAISYYWNPSPNLIQGESAGLATPIPASNGDIGGKGDIKFIKELQGLFFANPLLSLTLSISLFSMAGIPPLIGFFSKQFVLYSALDQGYYFISILAIIVSVISASYYLKIIKILHTVPLALSLPSSDVTDTNHKEEGAVAGSAVHSFIISSLSLFILLFILKPTLILSSTQVLSLTLFKI